jgi:hypothetical protein
MHFQVAADGSITQISEGAKLGTDPEVVVFGSEQEWIQVSRHWPVKRLVEIWNKLPAVQPVQRFENRQKAVRRVWRRLAPPSENIAERTRSRAAERPTRTFREGSKAAQVCALLSRPQGATLGELRELTGWQAHSVRGFLSGSLGKQGRRVRSFRRNDERVYRMRA